MKWKIEVEKVNNGYILNYINDEENQQEVFQCKDENDETNRDHVIAMLYTIIDVFSELGTKHDKRRIKIGYRKGDEYELKEAEEGIDYDIVE